MAKSALQSNNNILYDNTIIINSLSESFKDFIFVLDTKQRYIRAFGTLMQRLNIKSKDIIGKTIYQVLPSYEKRAEANERALHGEAVMYEWSTRIKGTELHFETSLGPIKDDDGKVVGIIGITRDRTEHVYIEDQKQIFLGVASHELKNNLASIKAFTQLLQKHLQKLEDEKALSFISKIDAKIYSITTLINDLLDVTKIRTNKLSLRKQEYGIDDFVAEVVEDLQHLHPTYTLVKKGKTDLTVAFDKDRIEQVLVNIIRNAIKYSPDANKIIISLTKNTKEVTIKIQDFGIGIPKDKLKAVFLPFIRVDDPDKGKFPGFGLGLYICAEIVQLHGGRIWVESEEGKGSTFIFTLPIE